MRAFRPAKPFCPTQDEGYSHLCSSIDLGLPDVFTLTKHGGGHKFIPILLADEIRDFEKDDCAVSPRHSFPLGLGRNGAINGPCNNFFVCLMVCADVSSMVRRNQLLRKLVRLDLHEREMGHEKIHTKDQHAQVPH